jgi:DNA-binding SARP family transcriptional activator
MEFRILGPLEVREGDRVLPVPGVRQRALLSILLLRANEVLPASLLIELLWGDRPPPSAAKGLQVHVSELRKLLGKDCIYTRAPGYGLRVPASSTSSGSRSSSARRGSCRRKMR